MGAKTLGIASFYLRAVCQNRNLWGVEHFDEITIRHSKYAASRFAHEAAPALTRFAESSPAPFLNGIRAARERVVARVGAMLPCNVILREEAGGVEVSAIDPVAPMQAIDNPALHAVAGQVRDLLAKAVAAI